MSSESVREKPFVVDVSPGDEPINDVAPTRRVALGVSARDKNGLDLVARTEDEPWLVLESIISSSARSTAGR